MIRTITKLKFKDSSIEAIKFSDLVFSYEVTDKQTGNKIIKHSSRLWIPFDVAKKSVLKGTKLCFYKSSKNKYFTVQYWFKRKPKMLTIGKFVLGVFGTKQCEEKLFSIVKAHTNDKGLWIKDPSITERDKTRVITDTQFTESKKKTINEVIVACLKADLPKGKRAGRLRAVSAQDLSRYMIGYNWRHKHLVFRDDKDGNGYITFKANWHKRTARPQGWEDLFTR